MKENLKYKNLNMPKPCSGPYSYKLRMAKEKSNKERPVATFYRMIIE